MPLERTYLTSTRAVLLAGRDLQEALEAGDEDEVSALTTSLLTTALARESTGAVAGLTATKGEPEAGPVTLEDELSFVVAELQVGEVLLSSSAAPAAGAAPLVEALDQLDTATSGLAETGITVVSGLFGATDLNPQSFFTQVPTTVDGIVGRTAAVGRSAVGALLKIPAASLQPIWTGALSVVPNVGALARAGLRAIARAIQALKELVPRQWRDQVTDWAQQWWQDHAESGVDRVVRRALSVKELESLVGSRLEAARARNDLPEARLRQGLSRLLEIDARHVRLVGVIQRIVDALSRLMGPLAAAIPAGAPWIFGSGGTAVGAAVGVAVWAGRDYLDVGTCLERVPGVRSVVAEAIG